LPLLKAYLRLDESVEEKELVARGNVSQLDLKMDEGAELSLLARVSLLAELGTRICLVLVGMVQAFESCV
jgi:hypothetical protein